jgi:hypothetical protein
MVFPFGTIGGLSSLNAHFYFTVNTSPSIDLRLKLEMASSHAINNLHWFVSELTHRWVVVFS